MKNYVQVKGHPELSFDTSISQLVDNRTGKGVTLNESNKAFEVYINGKWKEISSVLKGV